MSLAAGWPGPRVLAHRGGGSLAPENTLAALRAGQALGARGVEFDVMLSRDGVPLLMHDAELGRAVAGSGRVAELPASALLALDAGSGFGPAFAGERVPGYAVEDYPDNPQAYRLNHPRGALLVAYAGSEFDRTEDVGAVVQSRSPRVGVTVLLRQLNGRAGAVTVVDQVVTALAGAQPPGAIAPMWIEGDRYLGQKDAVWAYMVTVGLHTLFVQHQDDEPAAAPFDAAGINIEQEA